MASSGGPSWFHNLRQSPRLAVTAVFLGLFVDSLLLTVRAPRGRR